MKGKFSKQQIHQIIEEEFERVISESEGLPPSHALVGIKYLMTNTSTKLSDEEAFEVLQQVMEHIEEAMKWMYANMGA
jgi:ABC-type nitrate/sulfonate/bicarbonate transport system substrate-binding protein|tara:strand:- start:28217 stop:28450 length:234 start_codon:yes stop_codon:yes gene_type:complete